MPKFKEFKTTDGDPIIVNFDNVTAAYLEVLRRGQPSERVKTFLSLTSGVRVEIKEPLSEVRDWLMGTIS